MRKTEEKIYLGLGFQKDKSSSPRLGNMATDRHGRKAESQYLESQSVNREQTGVLSLWTLKVCLQWHTFSGKVILPKPIQTVPSIRDQVFKGLRLQRIFVIQTTTKVIIIFLNSLHTCRENKMKNNINKHDGEIWVLKIVVSFSMKQLMKKATKPYIVSPSQWVRGWTRIFISKCIWSRLLVPLLFQP